MSIVLSRPPQTEDELYHCVKALWGHTIPRHKVCEEHQAPFEAFATSFFNREPQILIHGSRGLSGKSRLLSILGLTMAAIKGSDVNILGGSLNQSSNIHETMRDAWEYKNAPRYLLKDESQSLIKLTNKAKIRPLTASQKTVRGPHPPTLLLDEIDEMDQAIFDAAKGQPMPQQNYLDQTVQAHTAMSSTWQYPDKTFAHEYKRFKDEGLPIFTWCMKDTSNPIDGWLDPDFIAQKKREIPAEMWRVEYELGEPSIGNRAFDSEAVERTFSLPVEPLKKKIGKDYQEYQFAEYNIAGEYVIGADWAKAQDYTVFSVYDCTRMPAKVVYWVKMRRRPYPVMISFFNRLRKVYHAEAIHDATGLGGVVSDYLEDHRARNFMMTGEKRDNMLSEYINAVENDKVRAPRVEDFYKAHLYCSVEDIYSRAKEFHLPDEVCSMALAWHLISRRVVASEPVVMAGTGKENYMKEASEHNTSRDKSGWVGEVHNKSGEAVDTLSLMV